MIPQISQYVINWENWQILEKKIQFLEARAGLSPRLKIEIEFLYVSPISFFMTAQIMLTFCRRKLHPTRPQHCIY